MRVFKEISNQNYKINHSAKSVAIVGGGPSALFILKEIVENKAPVKSLDIFEGGAVFGSGMPYSPDGAEDEHVTNLSCEEIPEIVEPVNDWMKRQDPDTLKKYGITPDKITQQTVLPRRLFGQYLEEKFHALVRAGRNNGIDIKLHANSRVADIQDNPHKNTVTILPKGAAKGVEFDEVVIATGHEWPARSEENIPGYFASPYPPSKLNVLFNHHVGLRGSSLTAIDALKTMVARHGKFERDTDNKLVYKPDQGTENFKVTMHSRHGLLPCVRFHFNNPRVSKGMFVSNEEINDATQKNGGTLPLDFLFEKVFKSPLKSLDPDFYDVVKDMSLEQFVDFTFQQRKTDKPFEFFASEFRESKDSMENHRPIPWKEMMVFLMSAVNFPAKRMSAEDMLRVRHVLMPLVSHIVAYLPHNSCEEILALHEAGKLDIIGVGQKNRLQPDQDQGGATYFYKGKNGSEQSVYYNTFVDCTGQLLRSFEEFPFKSMIEKKTVSPAKLAFQSAQAAKNNAERYPGLKLEQNKKGGYDLVLPGVAIDDDFHVVNASGKSNPRISIMATPHIGGFNPDFPGLDFSEDMAKLIVQAMGRKTMQLPTANTMQASVR